MHYFTRNRFLLVFISLHGFFKAADGSSSETYIGCYEDFGAAATFPVGDEVVMSIFTIDACRAGCRNTGFSFVGLWGGSRCYCATALRKERVRLVDNSLCASPCPGDPTISCGDSKSSTLYSVHSICPRGMFGDNCSTSCNCKDNKNCTVSGICPSFECADGWMLNETIPNTEQCSIDVDECRVACNASSTNCHNCGSEHQCINTQGSFTCICKEGFEFDAERICKDGEECEKETHNCNVNMKCINTDGSYKCAFQEGYKLSENFKCEESGLWPLVVGLGLATGVQSIVIVVLAITVCKLVARRNSKTTTTGSCRPTENEVEPDSYMQMTGEASPASVNPPNVYARINDQQESDSAANKNS